MPAIASGGWWCWGFPSNDFAHQEPGNEAQIQRFCRLTYGVRFPMFARTRVRPPDADPLYACLGETAGGYPQWNFHKYLLGRDGRLAASYPSQVAPDDPDFIARIAALLRQPAPSPQALSGQGYAP